MHRMLYNCTHMATVGVKGLQRLHDRGSSEHGLTDRLTMRQEIAECPLLSCCCCWWWMWWWWCWLWWWWGWLPSSLLGPRPLSLLESPLFGEQFSPSIRSFMNATTGFDLFVIGCKNTRIHTAQREAISIIDYRLFPIAFFAFSQWLWNVHVLRFNYTCTPLIWVTWAWWKMSAPHTVFTVCHICAKNYQSWWKFDEVMTKIICLGLCF